MYLRTEFGILRVFVRVDRVWDPMSVRTCGQTLESCKCVFLWKELGIVCVCVRADGVSDSLSMCRFGQSLRSCECGYVWTEFSDCVSM